MIGPTPQTLPYPNIPSPARLRPARPEALPRNLATEASFGKIGIKSLKGRVRALFTQKTVTSKCLLPAVAHGIALGGCGSAASSRLCRYGETFGTIYAYCDQEGHGGCKGCAQQANCDFGSLGRVAP